MDDEDFASLIKGFDKDGNSVFDLVAPPAALFRPSRRSLRPALLLSRPAFASPASALALFT
jgi:hypothetical protein